MLMMRSAISMTMYVNMFNQSHLNQVDKIWAPCDRKVRSDMRNIIDILFDIHSLPSIGMKSTLIAIATEASSVTRFIS